MSQLYELYTELSNSSEAVQQKKLDQLARLQSDSAHQLKALLNNSDNSLENLIMTMHQSFIELENAEARIGRIIDNKYQITQLLGQGGMSDVYKARRIDGLIEHEVAIKYFALAESNEVAFAMIKKEAQILAKLDHQFIASFIDIGLDAHDEPNIMMEYIEGITLAEFLTTSPDNDAIEQVNESLSMAIEHATSRGFEHGDLSKNNVLIDKFGNANVVDFDIATYTRHLSGNMES